MQSEYDQPEGDVHLPVSRDCIVRCFIVGAPRSGTTLLQTRLVAHPLLISFPESHLLERLRKNRSGLRKRLDLISRAGREHARDFLRDAFRQQKVEPAKTMNALGGLRPETYTSRFCRCLDEVARRSSASGWIEKTPGHVRDIPLLERASPGAYFVHIIREGDAVVGSLYDVTQRYPHSWGGPWSLARCIRTWNEDVLHSLEHQHKSNHLLVSYEALVDAPQRHVRAIWRFLGMDVADIDPARCSESASNLVEGFEQWKMDATGPVDRARPRRAEALFSVETLVSLKRDLIFGGQVPVQYFERSIPGAAES